MPPTEREARNPIRGGTLRLMRYDAGVRLLRFLRRLHERLARRRTHAAPDTSSETYIPFVRETPDHKSLHFSSSETQSVMLKSSPYALVEEYTRAMTGFLVFHPRPRRLLMIGLGGGSLAKFCYHELPDARIDVVEINPHVAALRDEFRVPPDDARFRVVLDDGARFVRHADDRYDVLLVDAYTRDGVPPDLSTSAFFEDCRRALRDDGVLVVNLSSVRAHPLADRIGDAFGFTFALSENHGANRIVYAFRAVPAIAAPEQAGPPRVLPSLPVSQLYLMPVIVRVHAALHRPLPPPA